MAYEHILVEREDGVGIVTLNRPETLNAMNRKLGAELLDAVKVLEADDAIGCLVITGAGDKAFSAGGDIKEQLDDDRRYTREEQDRMGNPRRALEISVCAKPTIGMMNGLLTAVPPYLSPRSTSGLGARARAFASSLRHTGGLTQLGRSAARSVGRRPRSCCSPRASSRPKRPIASVFSIIWSPKRSYAPRRCRWRKR
jgi:Enoyl-CoA hydratase/isomerase